MSKAEPKISTADTQSYFQTHTKVREWISRFRPETQRLYARMILEFEQLSHQNLETILDRATNNQLRPVEIRSLINQTTKHLTNPKQVMIDAALRSFLRYWDKPLPTTDIKYDDSNTYRRYTKAELLSLIGFLDKPLEKLYAIIATESGLRASTILKLTYEHIREDLNNRANSIALRLPLPFHKSRKKSGYTFIGTRARELINYCIKHKLIDTQPESRLFPYSYSSIHKIIRTAKQKAEIPSDVHTIHGFRSSFKWALESPQPPIDSNRQKMMMGRFDDIDAKKYTDRDYETLRPEYERAYPFLDYTNNAPEQAQQVSDQQTELRDIISQQNQRIQRLEQTLQRVHESDTGILAILQSPGALRRTATFAEFVNSKKIPQQVLAALDALGYPQTYENIDIATRAYFEANPQMTKELRDKHPEICDPSENQKILAELKRALPSQ